jgi:peptidoglycan-associated lipoprotein
MSNPDIRKDWPRDRQVFKAYTVHFEYDSSAVKPGEKSKVKAVADYLKANTADAVEIEGHCDERGTEEYNRSLGDRRALALREALAAQGVDPMRVDTISYGKDRPVDTGKSEAAHRKNRRGEFVLEKHPQ